MNKSVLTGTIHGKTIELDQPSDLPDGQPVTVVVRPAEQLNTSAGQGLRTSAGAWADDAKDLDEYVQWNRQHRKSQRRELEP